MFSGADFCPLEDEMVKFGYWGYFKISCGARKEGNDAEHVSFIHLLKCSNPYVFIIQVMVIFKVEDDTPIPVRALRG